MIMLYIQVKGTILGDCEKFVTIYLLREVLRLQKNISSVYLLCAVRKYY